MAEKQFGTKAGAAPKVAQDRPKRKRMGAQDRLRFSKRPGYFRRVFNDIDDRLERALDAGYTFVMSKERGGTPRTSDASAMGSNVSKPVGSGVNGVLMEIPLEWHDTDQAEKQAEIDKTEESMRRPTGPGQYGGTKIFQKT